VAVAPRRTVAREMAVQAGVRASRTPRGMSGTPLAGMETRASFGLAAVRAAQPAGAAAAADGHGCGTPRLTCTALDLCCSPLIETFRVWQRIWLRALGVERGRAARRGMRVKLVL
jgi:hypothetical protein